MRDFVHYNVELIRVNDLQGLRCSCRGLWYKMPSPDRGTRSVHTWPVLPGVIRPLVATCVCKTIGPSSLVIQCAMQFAELSLDAPIGETSSRRNTWGLLRTMSETYLGPIDAPFVLVENFSLCSQPRRNPPMTFFWLIGSYPSRVTDGGCGVPNICIRSACPAG